MRYLVIIAAVVLAGNQVTAKSGITRVESSPIVKITESKGLQTSANGKVVGISAARPAPVKNISGGEATVASSSFNLAKCIIGA